MWCLQVYYCNRGCQKADWKLHKPICKALPYKIGSSTELGNFMVANKDLKQGEVFGGKMHFQLLLLFSPADSSRGSVGYRSQPDDDSRLLALLQSRRRQLQVNVPGQDCLRFTILCQGARNQVGLSADLTVPRRWPAGGRQTYLELLQDNRIQYQNVKHLYFQSRGACAGPDRCHL